MQFGSPQIPAKIAAPVSLNVGAQPAVLDASANVNTTQVAVITQDGTICVMNMGTFINKIVNAAVSDKVTLDQLTDAITNDENAIAAIQAATDKAIAGVNGEIDGQGTSLGQSINAIKQMASDNAAAVKANGVLIVANTSAIAKNGQAIIALQTQCESLQQQINGLQPKPSGK